MISNAAAVVKCILCSARIKLPSTRTSTHEPTRWSRQESVMCKTGARGSAKCARVYSVQMVPTPVPKNERESAHVACGRLVQLDLVSSRHEVAHSGERWWGGWGGALLLQVEGSTVFYWGGRGPLTSTEPCWRCSTSPWWPRQRHPVMCERKPGLCFYVVATERQRRGTVTATLSI